MICHNCNIPMETVSESADGYSSTDMYKTSEIKNCPKCGRRVKESYSAEIIKQ